MKKITLLMLLVQFILNCYNTQSPVISVPPNYVQYIPGGIFSTPLPTPEPSVVDPLNYSSFIDDYQSSMFTDATGNQSYVYDGRPAKSCSNSIFGPNGELLAFIIDENVFNKDGFLLDILQDAPNIYDGLVFGLSESEIAVIPHPENCNIYYIVFTSISTRSSDPNNPYQISAIDNLTTQVSYAILDLSLDRSQKFNNKDILGGLVPFSNGDLIKDLYLEPLDACVVGNSGQGIPRSGFSFIPEKEGNFAFAVTPLNLNNERFLFLEQNGFVHRFIVNSNGIELDNSKSDYTNTAVTIQCGPNNQANFTDSYLLSVLSFLPNNGTIDPLSSRFTRGELEVVMMPNGNYRLGFTYSYRLGSNGETLIVSFDFDNNGVFISGSETIIDLRTDGDGTSYLPTDVPFITGVEFSPSGNILYTVMQGNPSYLNENVVRFYDYSNPTLGMQHLPIADEHDFESGYIEMGLNNNLIISGNGKLGYLSDVETPDEINFNSSAVLLPGFVLSTNYVPSANINPNIRSHAYPLPDQIDGEDWQDRFNATCCDPVTGGTNDFTALTGTHTWSPGNNPFGNASGDVYINGIITIPSGANIIMNNMTFRFAELGKLNIEKGGRLTLYNTELTSRSCEGLMWQGVRVEGNPAATPSINNQGSFKAYQNSIVSNAYLGVANYLTDLDVNDPTNQVISVGSHGGLVKANSTDFINNVMDLELRGRRNYFYYFVNCDFVTSAQLLNPLVKPSTHVSLIQMRKVFIKGCDFRHESTAGYTLEDRGNGIIGRTSGFEVSFQCNSGTMGACPDAFKQRSTFSDLSRGVAAYNISFSSPVSVKYSDFDNVSFGVYLQAADNAFCVNNVFTNIGPLQTGDVGGFPQVNAYGLYLNNATGYAVENNNFSTNYAGLTYGTIVNNSNNNGNSSAGNLIYNNEYDNLDYGIAGVRENVGVSTGGLVEVGSGLQLRCNTLDNSHRNDIAWILGGISPNQGDCGIGELANNQFNSVSPSQGDFWNYNTQLLPNSGTHKYQTNYHIYSGTGGYNTPIIDYNGGFGGNTDLVNTCGGTFDPAIHCPVNRFDLSKKSLLSVKISGAKNLLIEADGLNETLDNANSEAISLKAQKLTGSISVGSYKNEMIALAGYLNDDRLKEQLGNDLNLPHGIVKNILDANAPFSQDLVNEINQASLPKGIKKQLENKLVKSGEMTPFSEILATKGYREVKSKLLINEVIRENLTDTTIVDGELVVEQLMKEFDMFYNKCDRTEFYVGIGNYAKAQELIDSVRMSGNTAHENFCKFNEMLMSFNQAMEGCGEIKTDIQKRQELELIASKDYNEKTCIRALGILNEILHYSYQEPIPEYISQKAMKLSNSQELEDIVETNLLQIYPNPSEGILNIFINDEGNSSGKVQVFDNLGKVVITSQLYNSLGYIEMTSFDKGIYHVVITTENGEAYTERVVLK